MNRRKYLVVSGLVAASTGGCTAVNRETHLTAGKIIEHGKSAVLPFRDDGEDILRLQIDKQYTGDEKRDYYPFFISTLQPDGHQLDSLRLKFRSPPHSSGFSPAGIALREDGDANKATLSQDGDDPSTTVIDLPDTTDIGQASVVIHLLFAGHHAESPQQLWMNAEAELSSDSLLGTDYSATGDFTLEFP